MKIEVIAFKTEHAEKYGVEAAILIQGIQLGLHLNKSKPSHVKMGKVWMYNSVREWHEAYPFMSESTIKRALNKLKELKIIDVMQLDSNPMNKTNWYTLNQSILSNCTTPLGQNDPIDEFKLNQSKQYKTNNVKQTIKEESEEKKKPIKRFVPPTLEEVQEYFKTQETDVDPVRFFHHYEASGWMRGKTKIQNWKACLKTWETRDKKELNSPKIKKATLDD